MAGMSIKATFIKPGRRSRGRVATSTRTIMRKIDPDAHPSQIMSVMAQIFPMLESMPLCYHAHGVRYDLLRVERRTERGVRVHRAIFKDQQAIHKSFAREMRRRHRATRRSVVRAGRDETRRRVACAAALLAMARAAHIKLSAPNALAARAPMLALPSLYLSGPSAGTLSAAPSGQQKLFKI